MSSSNTTGFAAIEVRWRDGVAVRLSLPESGDAVPDIVLRSERGRQVLAAPATGDETVGSPPPLTYVEDADHVFAAIRIVEETDYQLTIDIPIDVEGSRAIRRSPSIRQWPIVNPNLQRSVRVVSPSLWIGRNGSTRVPAFLNVRGYVGRVNLTVVDNLHSVEVEALSRKIGYENEYTTLLKSMAEHHLSLCYEISAVTGVPLVADFRDPATLASTLFQLRETMNHDELPAAIEAIIASPISRLRVLESVEPLGQARRIDAVAAASQPHVLDFRSGGPFSRLFHGCTPRRLPARRRQETQDVIENQYVLSFLEDLEGLLLRLKNACLADRLELALSEVERWEEEVSEWLAHDLWKHVGALAGLPWNSQQLQRLNGYRDVLRIDQDLRASLQLPWEDPEVVSVPNAFGDSKPVNRLYEYWCYFLVRGMLRRLFGREDKGSQDLLRPSHSGLSMRLQGGVGSRVTFDGGAVVPGSRIHLYYKPTFSPEQTAGTDEWSGSYSLSFEPDIYVVLETPRVVHCLSFDAKYRVSSKDVSGLDHHRGDDDRQTGEAVDFQRTDLEKMHCYRDAILGTRGSYVLYPGTASGEDRTVLYVRKPGLLRAPSVLPGVGAFPLRPGGPRSQIANLGDFIRKSMLSLAVASGYREEEGILE